MEILKNMSLPVVIVCELIIMGLALIGIYCNCFKFSSLLLKGLLGFNCFYISLIILIGLVP